MYSWWDLYICLISIAVWFVLDKALVAVGFFPYSDKNGRYFTLHVLCNAVVTVTTIDDVLNSYADPMGAGFGPCDNFGIAVMVGLHLYHIINFRPLDIQDWIHHIIMILIATPLAYVIQPGYLMGHGAFYATGLPGGLDYVMLVAVKKGWITSLTEKSFNSFIQQWVRLPGLIVDTFLIWMSYLEYNNRRAAGVVPIAQDTGVYDWAPPFAVYTIMAINALSMYWNGPYFAARVIRSHERHTIKQKQAKAATSK
eukprot:m.355055 g.355055  ORF g.355055 m.355055 type:complete len:254 (-) comp17168_c0_seq1:87-848(-)